MAIQGGLGSIACTLPAGTRRRIVRPLWCRGTGAKTISKPLSKRLQSWVPYGRLPLSQCCDVSHSPASGQDAPHRLLVRRGVSEFLAYTDSNLFHFNDILVLHLLSLRRRPLGQWAHVAQVRLERLVAKDVRYRPDELICRHFAQFYRSALACREFDR